MTSILFAAASVFAADGDWQSQLKFLDRTARASRLGDGTYRLDSSGSVKTIAKQAMRSETASPLVDALFALAQSEAAEAQVKELRDSAYNHGNPIPCDCYVTGVKWPFVWTRDSAYSIDLALGWLDPPRARRTLEFKLSGVRVKSAPQGLYVVQDTGSGGSWPISTDRVAWFLGARHLLDDAAFADTIRDIVKVTATALDKGHKLLLAGNGGSAADAQHLAGEMLSRLYYDRAPAAAIALTTDTSVLTAIGNDYGYDRVFERQIFGLGCPGDVFVAISTSGRSPNILRAIDAAREKRIITVGFTGRNGGEMSSRCDFCLHAPSDSTPLIQQIHITAGHIICGIVEERLFPRS